MQSAVLVAVLAFIVLFASLTISVIAQSGIDPFKPLAQQSRQMPCVA